MKEFKYKLNDRGLNYLTWLKQHDLTKLRCFVVKSSYYASYAEDLVGGIINCTKQLNIQKLSMYETSGTLEIPQHTKYILENCQKEDKYDLGVVVGLVIQGETEHNKFILNNTYSKVLDLSIEYNLPIGVGIVSANSKELIEQRTRNNSDNYGYVALLHAIYSHCRQKQLNPKDLV